MFVCVCGFNHFIRLDSVQVGMKTALCSFPVCLLSPEIQYNLHVHVVMYNVHAWRAAVAHIMHAVPVELMV